MSRSRALPWARTTLRERAKKLAERLLVLSGLPTAARTLRGRNDLLLAYHNVVPDGVRVDGDGSLHLPRRRFAEQLDALAESHEIVPVDALLRDAATARGHARAAITFDDAYRGAVTVGVEELAGRSLPATIFVAPALLGRDSFWWDALAEPGGVGLPAGFRREALHRCRGEDGAVRCRAVELGRPVRRVAPAAEPATERELRSAARVPGITLASHTWSHPNLDALSPAELRAELLQPLAWLRDRFRAVVPWLSYPYGLGSPRVEKAAAAAGYEAAVRIGGGPLPRGGCSRYALPRVHVPAGASPDGFLLRTAGLVG